MSSPPLTPLRQVRPDLSRRSSSLSNARSSVSRRGSGFSSHRLSNASRYSGGFHDVCTPLGESGPGQGMGNLADELDFADEDWDDEGLDGDLSSMSMGDGQQSPSLHHAVRGGAQLDDSVLDFPGQTDGARDSGIDIHYSSPAPSIHKLDTGLAKQSPTTARHQARRPSQRHTQETIVEDFTRDLEAAMDDIANLARPAAQQQADTIARTISALQDLSSQSTIEAQTQRLTTTTNSMTVQLVKQTRLITSLSSSLFSSIAFSAPLDMAATDDSLACVAQLLQDPLVADARPLQGLGKLSRETTDLAHAFEGLVDSLQMGKQTSASAARHLRLTQSIVTELRREMDRAEEARLWLEKEDWDRKLRERWCASQCRDVVGGFEKVCDGLRGGFEERATA